MLYQRVVLDSTCDNEPNVIGNVFGATQVIGFTNRQQGRVFPGAENYNTPGTVTALITPASGASVSVTVKSVEVETDYANPATTTYHPNESTPVQVEFHAWLYYPITYDTTLSMEGIYSHGATCSYTVTDVYDNRIVL